MKHLRPLIVLIAATCSAAAFAAKDPGLEDPAKNPIDSASTKTDKKSTSPDAAKKTKADKPTPVVDPLAPVLIGEYEHAFYRLAPSSKHSSAAPALSSASPVRDQPASLRRTSRVVAQGVDPGIAPLPAQLAVESSAPGMELRFFAARFTLAIEPGSDTIPSSRVYSILEQKAQEAAQVVAWNNVSISPHATINYESRPPKDWVIIGVYCPTHRRLHWLAYGYHDTEQRYEVYSNGSGDVRVHPLGRGWSPRHGVMSGPVPFPVTYWVAPVDEGGSVLEPFGDCGIKLLLAVARSGPNVTFGFQGPPISVVVLAEEDSPFIGSSSRDESLPASSDLVHYYAVVATLSPSEQGKGLERTTFDDILRRGSAARLGREVVRVRGTTLGDPSTLRQVRLPKGKALVLGAYNASSQEHHWLVATRDKELVVESFVQSSDETEITTLALTPTRSANGLGPWYVIPSGSGLDIKLHIDKDPDNPAGVEFFFVAPR